MAGLFGLASARKPVEEKPVSRFLFLTDIHLPAEGRNTEAQLEIAGFSNKFGRHDMTILGGDNIFGQPEGRASEIANWKSFSATSFPGSVHTVVGNHDICGWKPNSKDNIPSKKDEAVSQLGMPHRYYSFEHSGWRFLMLDSVQPDEKFGYVGHIDAEQMEWMKSELAKDKRPTVVVSHIPILSASELASSATVASPQGTKVTHQRLVSNNHEVLEVFRQNEHVKLCLSGHLHMVDTVRFRHTKFVCGGAFSGGWWKTENEHFGRIGWSVDLFADGKAKAWPLEFGPKRVLVS